MTRISHTNALSYAMVPIEEIRNHKKNIDASIKENQWSDNAERDFKLMPAFIARANEKDKNLNAYFVRNGINELTDTLAHLTSKRVRSARFVVNLKDQDEHVQYHFAAFDYRATRGGKASLIGVDSAIGVGPDITMPSLRANYGATIMLDQLATTLRTRFPETAVIFMETNIQKSTTDCGMFSLAFVKKMSQEKSAFDKLHQKNIAGQLGEDIRMDPDAAYKLLPPSFLKHAHARSTLASFRARQREALDESSRTSWSKIFSPLHKDPMKQTVSKKRDASGKKYTLESWAEGRLVTREVNYEEKTFSRSIELKRQNEINKLLLRK